MSNNLKQEKLVNNEYWEIISVKGKYLVVNTKRLKDQERGVTSPETVGSFSSLEEAVEFLNDKN